MKKPFYYRERALKGLSSRSFKAIMCWPKGEPTFRASLSDATTSGNFFDLPSESSAHLSYYLPIHPVLKCFREFLPAAAELVTVACAARSLAGVRYRVRGVNLLKDFLRDVRRKQAVGSTDFVQGNLME